MKIVGMLICMIALLTGCGQETTFSSLASLAQSTGADDGSETNLDVCNGVSCDLDPITKRPAVTTILLALGDEANAQLVVAGNSAQLIAETVVRYSSPKRNPRILVVQDHNIGGEDPEDTVYVFEVLLQRYAPDFLVEPMGGLTDAHVAGYDLIWFNNPGHKMSYAQTRDVLMRFGGGVVLQGDDLSIGNGFSLEALTGLRYEDNGTSVQCGPTRVNIDNNLSGQYAVRLDPAMIPGAQASAIEFHYGNDIDKTSLARSDLEVLAYARGDHSDCIEERAAIVRYLK